MTENGQAQKEILTNKVKNQQDAFEKLTTKIEELNLIKDKLEEKMKKTKLSIESFGISIPTTSSKKEETSTVSVEKPKEPGHLNLFGSK